MVSIKDVAKQAGVAISTVSKVLNHYPNITVETKDKVNRAIDELNFVPNTIASALSSKQPGRAALLISLNSKTQAIDEINMQYLSGAIHEAGVLKLDIITVFFSMIREKTLEEITNYFKAQNIAGIIIYGMSKEDRVLHELIASENFRIVTVDAPMVNSHTSAIWIDQKKAQYEIAKKTILENNASRILYIAGKRNGYVTEERILGMNQLAKELGLTVLIRYGEFSELESRKLTYQYGRHKDAVVCASDIMAIGAVNALTDMDIFRPVCGFDGIMLMGYVGKQMNTVRQDFFRVSKEAVKELAFLMGGGEGRENILDYAIVKLQYLDIIC